MAATRAARFGSRLYSDGARTLHPFRDGLHRDGVEAADLEQRSAGGHDLGGRRPRPRGTHAFAPSHAAEMGVLERGRQLEAVTDRSIHADMGDTVAATSWSVGAASHTDRPRTTNPGAQVWARL